MAKTCLCGNCRIRYHMPMDLKEALPTSAMHNKYTDLNLGCRQCIGLWTSPSPSQPWSQTAVHEWESLCGSPSCWQRISSTPLEWKKKKMVMCIIREGKRSSMTLPTPPLSLGGPAQGQERPSWLVISPTEVGKNMWVSAQLPELCGTLPKRLISLLPHPEYQVASCMTEVWKGIKMNWNFKQTQSVGRP